MKIRYLWGGSLFAAALTAMAVAAGAEQSASKLSREPTSPIADRVTLPIAGSECDASEVQRPDFAADDDWRLRFAGERRAAPPMTGETPNDETTTQR
jgi:hypothetical protein